MRELSAEQLSIRSKISLSYLRKLESGDRTPSPRVLQDLAKALKVGPEYLTGQPYYGNPEREDRVHAVIPELRRLLLCYDYPADTDTRPRPLAVLASEVDQISALRRDARYAPMGPLLPQVLTELTHYALNDRNSDRHRAFVHLARAYRAVNSLAHKLGHHDLSNTALERVRWAAGQSGDNLLKITASYLVVGAMIRSGAFDSARRLLLDLRAQLERDAPEHAYTADHLAVDGALVLKLAVVESRANNAQAALDYLEEARDISRMAGGLESPAYDLSFGPTNINIHHFHILSDLTETGEALARLGEWGDGEEWAPPSSTFGERASHHYIDLGAAKLVQGDRAGAFAALEEARHVSATHTRFHPQVRETTEGLLRAERHPSHDLARFGSWVGLSTN
jgi:transcriptional regulator with XRE-family HTH domain